MVKVRINENWHGKGKKDKMPPSKDTALPPFKPYYTTEFNGPPENRAADDDDKRGSYDIACDNIKRIGWTSNKAYPWLRIKEYHENLRKKAQEKFEASVAGREWGKYTTSPDDDRDMLAEQMRLQLRNALNEYYIQSKTGIYNMSDLYVSVYGFSRYGGIGNQFMESITLKDLITRHKGLALTGWCRTVISYWTGENLKYLKNFEGAAEFWTGWTLKSSTNGRGIILAATYGPGFKEWRDKAAEDWQNAHRRPQCDPYGYGGDSGNWTGD